MEFAEAVHVNAEAERKGRRSVPLPDFPEGLEWLWGHFSRLSRRRQAGMAANPLTFSELEAYERKALLRFTAWETALLMRLDDAVLGVWAGGREGPRPAPAKPGEPIEIDAANTAGVGALLRGMATRKAAQLARSAKTKGGEHGRRG